MAAHRQSRPWSGGEVAARAAGARRPYDRAAAICVPATRGSAASATRVHRHVRLRQRPSVRRARRPDACWHRRRGRIGVAPATGIARVVCYSPRHDVTLAELAVEGVDALLADAGRSRCASSAARPEVAHVLIFENKGEAVGVRNPHPHCQIYATNFVFKYIETEARAGERHLAETGRVLFQDILTAERAATAAASCASTAAPSRSCRTSRATRTRSTSRPRATHATLATSLAPRSARDLADGAARRTVIRFDNLWKMPFPYVMALHQAPTDGGDASAASTSTSSSIRRCGSRTC